MVRHLRLIQSPVTALAAWVALTLTPLAGLPADVVYLADDTRVFGRLDRQTDEHVFFQQRIGPNQYRERTIRQDQIVTMVRTIDQDRLAALRPDNPADYRDYAEELAAASDDPEARDLALRPYLLTAYLAPHDLRESALLGMIRVARNDMERRRCEVLAFQLLGRHLIRAGDPVPPTDPVEAIDRAAVQDLLSAIRLIRRGRSPASASLIDQPPQRRVIQRFSHICSWQELVNWSNQTELSTADLAKLLRLELALIRQADDSTSDEPPPTEGPPSASWSRTLRQNAQPVALVDFSNVCEFDVNHSVFRDGQWTSPEEN